MIKHLRILIILLFIASGCCIAQYNNWVFSSNNHVSFDLVTGMPTFISNQANTSGSWYYPSISDKLNNLLFYSGGGRVINRLHQVMKDGVSLLSHENINNTQIILPVGKDSNLFYIFGVGSKRYDTSKHSTIYYHIVDLTYENGLGQVIKMNVLFKDSVKGTIATIRHTNKRDYWIILRSSTKPVMYSYLFTYDGDIIGPIENNIETINGGMTNASYCHLKFSPTGKILASVDINENGLIELYDFSRETGIISNPFHFHYENDIKRYSVEFSPNEKFMYVAMPSSPANLGIYQFDITQRDSAYIYNNAYIFKREETYARSLQLAPDGSIYFVGFFVIPILNQYKYYLSKITFPNRKGEECEIVLDALQISESGASSGLPQHPCVFDESICDTNSFEFSRMNVRDFELVGTANELGSVIRLTDTNGFSAGALWYNKKLNLNNGFVCDFKFRLSVGDNKNFSEDSYPGADGIAFVIQNTSIDALGRIGGGIGYDSLKNALAFEIDLFHNRMRQDFKLNDPNGNHFAIQANTDHISADHSSDSFVFINPDIMTIRSDSSIYYLRIIYKPGNIFVYLDTSRAYSLPPICSIPNFYLENYLDFSIDSAFFVGFTAATGRAVQNHDIEDWYFCVKPSVSNLIVTVDENVNENSNSIENIIISPNPATNYIGIAIPPLEKGSGGVAPVVKVFNVLGVCVITSPPAPLHSGEGSKVWLDVSHLPTGVYFVQIGNRVCRFVKM